MLSRVITVVLAATAISACSKAPPCPNKFDAQTPAECSCNGPGSGSIWGTGIYTTDSPLCSAAVHSGAAKPSGGTVKPRAAPGCGAYVGSEANGIKTSKWGSYASSFYFEGHGDGKCAAAPAQPAAAAGGVAQGGACPSTIGGFANAAATNEFSCTCPAQTSGSVYGTGIYTTDSNLCRAALHAGAISASGGAIKAKRAPGCSKYVGTAANGVSTTSWGSYGNSFYFDGHGNGTCAP